MIGAILSHNGRGTRLARSMGILPMNVIQHNRRGQRRNRHHGFTLIEVMLVIVIVVIMAGIAMPHMSSFIKGSRLRSSARIITRMAVYARSMSIMTEKPYTIVLDSETMEVYLGAEKGIVTNETDGVIDQDVLDRLGYTDGDETGSALGIDKEVFKFLPDQIEVAEFESARMDEDLIESDGIYYFKCYPNGHSDRFSLKLMDQRGTTILLENDPVSGRIRSEFISPYK